MRERVRQTESGRIAWKKCGFGGGSLFFREGCRRKEELCVAGSRWERGPRVCGTEEMLLWGGRGGGKEGGTRAGDNQLELSLGGDTKRDAVPRVP